MSRPRRRYGTAAWVLVVGALFACETRPPEEGSALEGAAEVVTQPQLVRFAGLTRLDTVQYHIESELRLFRGYVRPGDRFGVWVTPPRGGSEVCSLVEVEYIFDDVLTGIDSVSGFVNRVRPYAPTGPALDGEGVEAISFPMATRSLVSVDLRELGGAILVDDSTDFLVGWISTVVDTMTVPRALGDSVGDYFPSRSYQLVSVADSFLPLPSDLAVRSVFEYYAVGPDTLAMRLTWTERDTDLDIYLVARDSVGHADTAAWFNKSTKTGGLLDVDDNDGYGPERIIHPIRDVPWADTLAVVNVHYYGPVEGDSTRAWVEFLVRDTVVARRGPCMLAPYDLWQVAWVDLFGGDISWHATCQVGTDTLLSRVAK